MSVIARRTLRRGAQASGRLGVANSRFAHYGVFGTVSVNPPNIAANTTGVVSVTIPGLSLTDEIFFDPSTSLETGLAYAGCRITSAETVQIRLANATVAAINGAALSWRYTIVRTR